MLIVKSQKSVEGTCEVCDKENVIVTVMHGNITMCSDCAALEVAAVTRAGDINNLLENSKKIDTSIQVKQDVFNAKTVAAIELQASIQSDENVKDEDKLYIFAKTMQERADILKKAIFDDRVALLEKENEYRMWQSQIQSAAGMIRDKRREEFKAQDIDYKPEPAKKPKSAKPTDNSNSKYKGGELQAAAKKYDVPATVIRTYMIRKNMTAEQAALFFIELSK